MDDRELFNVTTVLIVMTNGAIVKKNDPLIECVSGLVGDL